MNGYILSPDDRRDQSRLAGPFPVRVRGVNVAGLDFDTHTLADNLSLGGLYLQLPCPMAAGTRFFAISVLPGGAALAARCYVLRMEPKAHGLSGMAVRFHHARLLPGFLA